MAGPLGLLAAQADHVAQVQRGRDTRDETADEQTGSFLHGVLRIKPVSGRPCWSAAGVVYTNSGEVTWSSAKANSNVVSTVNRNSSSSRRNWPRPRTRTPANRSWPASIASARG